MRDAVAVEGGGGDIVTIGPVNELGVHEEHEYVDQEPGTCKTPFQYGMDEYQNPTNFGQGELCATEVASGKRPDMKK
jgi:hypothetical protein